MNKIYNNKIVVYYKEDIVVIFLSIYSYDKLREKIVRIFTFYHACIN